MNDFSLAEAAVGGLLALLGVYAGAALTRRTEYEKWLRQEKSKVFAEFLQELHECRIAASDAYYGQEGTELAKSIKATEVFARLQKSVGIGRLYMTEKARARFTRMVDELWLNCTAEGGPANQAIPIKRLMDDVQLLLEHELTHVPGKVRLPFQAQR